MSLIQPYAPHVAEELWAALGPRAALGGSRGPSPTSRSSQRDTFELVVQVNGKVRDRFEVDASTCRRTSSSRSRRRRREVQAHLDGATVRKTIVVPGKLVNFVVA